MNAEKRGKAKDNMKDMGDQALDTLHRIDNRGVVHSKLVKTSLTVFKKQVSRL